MKVQLERWIDEWLGRPLCQLLTVHRKFLHAFTSGPKPINDVRRILIIKLLGIGSIILTLPLIRYLRRQYPSASITFLTFRGNRDVFSVAPLADGVITLDSSSFGGLARDVFRVLSQLHQREFDWTIDLEFFSRFSAMLSYLSGARRRNGFYLPEIPRGDLLTERVFYSPYRHISQIFLSTVAPGESLIIPEPDLFRFEIPVSVRQSHLGILEQYGLSGKPFIAVNPNSGEMCLERRWSAESFSGLIRRAMDFTGVPSVFLGSPEEEPYTTAVARRVNRDRVVNLAGNLSIPEVCTVLSDAALLISNDSGPLHLAAALGRPTVSFFGPESPLIYGPVGEDHLVFFQGIHCSPCLTVHNRKIPPCEGNNVCLNTLSVDAVWPSVQRHLERILGARR